MTHSRRGLLALSLSLLTAGFLASEAAVVLPLLLSELDLTAGQGGWILSVRFLGGTAASLVLIVAGNRVSFRGFLLFSAGVILGTSALLPVISGYALVLIASFVRGISLTLLIAVSNAALSAWFWKNPERWSAYVHAWFGVGLIAAPVLGFTTVLVSLGWRTVWAIGGLLAIPVAVASAALPGARTPRGAAAPVHSVEGAAEDDRRLPVALWILPIAVAVFNVGVEGSIIGWVPSYVVLTGGTPGAGQLSSLLLAAGIVVGRMAAARIAQRTGGATLYHGSLLAVGATSLCVLFVPALRAAIAPLLGLSMAAMYPTMVSRFGRRARRSDGRLYAATELAATLGGTALPALVGVFSDRVPELAFPAVILAALLVLFALSGLFEREERALSAVSAGPERV